MSKKVCKVKQGLLLLGCLVAAVGCKQAPPTQMETGYEVMTVSPTDRMISSAYSATIRGRQDIDIYPQVSGTIERLCVTEGEKVRKGQILFVIDQVPYTVEQPHVELHLRLQHRFPRLQQQREPPHPLLPQHVPARRNFDGGDDRTVYRSKAKTIDENHSHHLAGRASAGRRGDHRLAGPPYGGRLPRRDGRGQNHAHP